MSQKWNSFMGDNLFIKTLLVITVGVAVAGAAGIYLVQPGIESKVPGEAVHDAEFMIQPQILKILSEQDLTQPLTEQEYAELDRLVQDNVLDPHAGRVQRIKLGAPAACRSTLRWLLRDSSGRE